MCVCLNIQGNFFQNIGSITLFAVIGTAISAFIVGGGIYFLGQVRIDVSSNSSESTIFGTFSCVCSTKSFLSAPFPPKADVIYKMTMTDR